MKRRQFISLVCGAAVVWPLVVRAQKGESGLQVGYLYPGTQAAAMLRVVAWRIGLAVLLVLGLILAPIAAEAQEAGKLWRIGFLSPYSADYDKSRRAALLNGLRDLGYV